MAQLVVAGQHRPDVGVAGVAPGFVEPRVDAELVRPVRHGVEVPGVLAGADVPGAHPARHRLLGDAPVGDVRAVDHLVSHDDRRRVDPEQHRVEVVAFLAVGPRQPDHRVDPPAPLGAEVGARPPGLRVDADQVAVPRAPEDALVPFAVGPVRDPPLRPGVAHRRAPLLVALRVVDPQRLAGGRVDRHALRQRRVEVEHPAHHQRRRLQARQEWPVSGPVEIRGVLDQRVDHGVERGQPLAAAGRRPADEVVHRGPLPGDLQVREVACVDLVERRVFLAADVAGVAAPLAVGGVVGLPRPGALVLLGVHGGGPAKDKRWHHGEKERLAHDVTSCHIARPG